MKHFMRLVFTLFALGLWSLNAFAQSITTGAVNSPICAGSVQSVSFTVTGVFSAGNIFTAQLSDNTGSFSSPIGIGNLNGTTSGAISITIPANSITDTGYRIRIISSNPAVTGSVNGSNITINADTPSITIGATATTLCSGTAATLRATTFNGGVSPTYQWQKNGNNVGLDTAYYTDTLLVNDDVITCILTSNDACATTATAHSNVVTLTVSQVDTPGVTIVTSQNDTICAGTSITFTAIPTHGGNSPVFQWKVNGQNVGSNSTNFTSDSLNNNDVISCELTSNAPCIAQNSAISNNIRVIVNPVDTPAITITASQTFICNNVSVTFTAQHTGGGVSPIYQWTINGNNVGADSTTFTTHTLANNDLVSCLFTSSARCALPRTAFANSITMTVMVGPTPTIQIHPTRNHICSGTKDTLNAGITNGGGSPHYQWKINGNNVGVDSSLFIWNSFADNDTVSCILVSSLGCVSQDTVSSNTIIIRVSPSSTPTVEISATHTNTCLSSSSTFTANALNGGPSPTYQWIRNGIIAGGDSTTYTVNNLTGGDAVFCIYISSDRCATTDSAFSNIIHITDSVLTPTVTITATQTTICSGTSITFTATPLYGGTSPAFRWIKSGVTVGTNSAIYADDSLRNGEVVSCILTSNSACITTNTAQSNFITISDSEVTPIVRVSATETSICPGTFVVFTAYSSNGGNQPLYQWKLNGQNVGSDTTVYTSSNLNNNDVITCTMLSSVTCVTNDTAKSNLITMNVHPPVVPSISIAPSITAACPGTNVTFTTTVSNGGSNPIYLWKRNANYTGNNVPTYTTSSLNSSDSVTCILVSNAICAFPDTVASNSVAINIYPLPNVIVTPSGNIAICKFDSILIQASADNTASFLWSTNATTQSIIIKNTGIYTVTVTSADNCTAESSPVIVAVNGATVPVISQSTYTLVSTPAATYQWYLNDTILTGDTAETLDFIYPGNYQVAVTDSNGCSAISDTFIVYNTAVYQVAGPADAKIYPNPNSGSFNIEFGDAISRQIEIRDITGRIVLPETTANKQFEVKMQAGSSGLYFLKVTQNKKVRTFKILVTQ